MDSPICESCILKDRHIESLMKIAEAAKSLLKDDPVRFTALLIRRDLLEQAVENVKAYESEFGEIGGGE